MSQNQRSKCNFSQIKFPASCINSFTLNSEAGREDGQIWVKFFALRSQIQSRAAVSQGSGEFGTRGITGWPQPPCAALGSGIPGFNRFSRGLWTNLVSTMLPEQGQFYLGFRGTPDLCPAPSPALLGPFLLKSLSSPALQPGLGHQATTREEHKNHLYPLPLPAALALKKSLTPSLL